MRITMKFGNIIIDGKNCGCFFVTTNYEKGYKTEKWNARLQFTYPGDIYEISYPSFRELKDNVERIVNK